MKIYIQNKNKIVNERCVKFELIKKIVKFLFVNVFLDYSNYVFNDELCIF